MMRSLYSGVSGLKTHQTKMDVIGNNIANVNTVAYKASNITFNELMSQTTQSASGPNAATGTGGTNARQIGLGVKSGAINYNIDTQGASQSTGNPFDIMITGSSFFIVNNGVQNYFTRDGSFTVDALGNLVMASTGYNVMGWQVDETGTSIKQDTVSSLKIMTNANMTYPPEATSQAYIAGILDKNDTNVNSASGKTVTLNFYDNLGYSYTAKFSIKKSDSATESEYSLELDKILDSVGKEVDISGLGFGSLTTQAKKAALSFDSSTYNWGGTNVNQLQLTDGTVVADLGQMFGTDGKLLALSTPTTTSIAGNILTVGDMIDEIAKAYGYEGATDEFLSLYVETGNTTGTKNSVETLLYNMRAGAPTGVAGIDYFNTSSDGFTVDGRNFNGFNIAYNSNNGNFVGVNGSTTNKSFNLNLSALGGQFSDINVDMSVSTMVNNKGSSTINATSGDLDGLGTGRRKGDMTGISIQQNGMIYASYSNNMTKLLGQIAVAEFANAAGLEKMGDNLYGATLNSGEFDGVGTDITTNSGYMATGQLEMSNVDLSSEFTEMITTQRGFQANSRIITVSDTLLEELTNLKR